jgi:hypothetical protein
MALLKIAQTAYIPAVRAFAGQSYSHTCPPPLPPVGAPPPPPNNSWLLNQCVPVWNGGYNADGSPAYIICCVGTNGCH